MTAVNPPPPPPPAEQWEPSDEWQQEPVLDWPERSATYRRLVRLAALAAALVVWFVLRLLLLQVVVVLSPSMGPTLERGEVVRLSTTSSWERGSIVTFDKPGGPATRTVLIKRIIGLPGETVRFAEGEVYIDGFRLEEPYLLEQGVTNPLRGGGQDLFVVPENEVFVMGDNRRGSADSRLFGTIPVDTIQGVKTSGWWWPFRF